MYLIERNPDYELVPLFNSNLIFFFFKLTLKTVFRAFQLKFQYYFRRGFGIVKTHIEGTTFYKHILRL